MKAESLGPVALKGKTEPMVVHRVLGLSTARAWWRATTHPGAQRP